MRVNPVLNIEMKRHARTLKCCWIFFGVNLLLGLIFLVSYFSIVGEESYLTLGDYRYMIQCYTIMAYALFGVLCLVVPGISGTTLTREREKNTMDILLSTQLKPWRIISGKLMVSLWMILLILISSYPMISILMMLGEVSLADLIWLTASLFLIGIFMGSIGIFFSAVCKASNRAVICTYVVVLGITVGTPAMVGFLSYLMSIRMEQMEIYQQVNLGKWIYILLLNPLTIFLGVLSKQVGSGNELLVICNNFGTYSEDFLVTHMSAIAAILQLAVAILLLFLAARRLNSGTSAGGLRRLLRG